MRTWKKLGICTKPIIIINVDNYFEPLLQILNKDVEENFMREEHKKMWSVVEYADQVIDAIENAPVWNKEAIGIAAI